MKETTEWKTWKTEAEMVAEFCNWARHHGWTPYPETGNWDVILVRPDDGFQIGIEAKLSLNAKVLLQAMKVRGDHYGPDVIAVLVPRERAADEMRAIARHLRIAVITGTERSGYDRRDGWTGATFAPQLPIRDPVWVLDEWPEQCPDKRHKLPDYVPDVTGGCSAPIKLTTWKIKAIKAVIVLKLQGKISRDDLRALDLDPRRWTDSWLRSDGTGTGNWLPTEHLPDFKRQHPRNYAEIEADIEKWWTKPTQPQPTHSHE